MAVVMCVGLVAADLVMDLDAMPEEGTKVQAAGGRLTFGGGAAIAAATVARQGGHARLVGRVGDDLQGQMVQETLARLGVDVDAVQRVAGAPTPISAILLSAGGERTIVNHRTVTLFNEPPCVPRFPSDGVALADTRWPKAAMAVFSAARALGRPAVLDVEAPVAAAADAMALATHLACSEQGLADAVGEASPTALKALQRRFGAWTCVTRGAHPVLVADGQGVSEVPGIVVKAIDTLGAGDVWHGSFALALADGREEQEAVKRANVAAALSVQSRGLEESLPTAEAIDAALSCI